MTPQGVAESLQDTYPPRPGRGVRDDLQTALVVVNLHAEWVNPSVRAVALALGLSIDAAHNRLLAAVDAGWLVQNSRGAFRPSRQLSDHLHIGDRASVQVMEGGR